LSRPLCPAVGRPRHRGCFPAVQPRRPGRRRAARGFEASGHEP